MASFHLITLIIVVMAYSSSALIDINQCISYRYLPCINGKNQDPTLISKDETIIKYNESTCIVYQYVPCRDGLKSLSLMYNNASKGVDQSTSCQSKTALATALLTKSYCESNLTSCLGQKDDITIELKNKANDWEIRYHKSVNEKKFLSDYMVSVWDTRIIDEEAEKAKPIKDRMRDYIRYSVARLGLRELVNVPPLIPDFGVVYNDILSIKYPINVPGCYKNGAATSLYPSLFVAVSGVASTDINNQKRRDEIRTIFNKEIPDLKKNLFSSINFAFFLGQPVDVANQNLVDQESAKNKDVIQVDMIDNGKNDSMKMAAIFNWVRQFCGDVDVVFKIDENFQISTLRKLGSALTDKLIPDTFVYGVKGDMRPQREVGKRMITMEEFPWKTLPAYFNGLAYFITGNMIEPLMAAFQTVPMLPLEDVYLGICIIKSDMKLYTYCGRDIGTSKCF
ncbi:uncharacterized protein LOC124208705 [Daphnia pulex]|uniref:uncharacterized protein LOC124208705 n=1 Tax=Daphnia pulex TaxID=6669 RepID=UPI001EDDA503|nr:uncharacterized protein LOC124208705 [Daphnia pulex]